MNLKLIFHLLFFEQGFLSNHSCYRTEIFWECFVLRETCLEGNGLNFLFYVKKKG